MTVAAHFGPHRRFAAARPSTAALVLDQIGHATRDLWRSRIVLVFTFMLPLAWLLVIGLLAGTDAVHPGTGMRFMQYVTPAAAVMGLLFAAYPPVANGLALAREQKVAKRLAGTPLPPWAYLLGRVGGAVVFAVVSTVVMLGVGVVVYDVRIQWHTVPATLVTLVVGIGSLAALGLAVGALAHSAASAQAVSMGSAVLVAFLSGPLTVGGAISEWMRVTSSVFPVRPLLTSLQDQFNPFRTGPGWDPGALAVMAAWGALGIAVAGWALRHEPGAPGARAGPRRAAAGTRIGLVPARAERPSALSLVLDQTRWATMTLWRDVGWIFFAVAMPVGLYALLGTAYRDAPLEMHGLPFLFVFAGSMSVYGAAVTAFVGMPEVTATARDRGVLKRLRGTPLAPWQYLAGRTASILWVALFEAGLLYSVAVAFFSVEVPIEGVPVGAGIVVLGTLTLAACGFALAAVAPSGKATPVVGLGILLPLSFFSDVFPVGDPPAWMGALGSLFPLRPFVHALSDASSPAGPSVAWTDVAVMVAWLAGASLVAVRTFRWQPGPS